MEGYNGFLNLNNLFSNLPGNSEERSIANSTTGTGDDDSLGLVGASSHGSGGNWNEGVLEIEERLGKHIFFL